ncbi:type VI secretion system Vgr family protein [Roseateles sp. BYS180W]|uniref:Type VI secretion system Vgr family protein n=1 Tax=Roseateles rivi TaxID=3299028 RepID=A0ABW7FRY3_9BURK
MSTFAASLWSSLSTHILGELASRLDFARLLDQQGRLLQLQTALPNLALIPERLVLRETLNQPFELVLDALSTSRYLELKALVGEQVTVQRLLNDGRYSAWHGYVMEAVQLGADGGLARYRLVLAPWLSFLGLRRDCFVYQDKTALEVIEDIFRDYPQAHYELRVSEPLRRRSVCVQYRETDLAFVQRLLAQEGLSYHWQHQDSAQQRDGSAQARHTMVICDRHSPRDDLGTLRFAQAAVAAGSRGDTVTQWRASRQIQAQHVALASWDYKTLHATVGQADSALQLGELPALSLYDSSGAYRYEDPAHAQRAAELALNALELSSKHYEGQSQVRQLRPGVNFGLSEHPIWGLDAQGPHPTRNAQRFVTLAVEHHVANNLGGAMRAGAAPLLEQATELESGSYRNHFHAAPADAALVPRWRPQPTAPGLLTALVVGPESEPTHSDRDGRVKVQFPWQRGVNPAPGGLAHNSSADANGQAPGNEQAFTWVRVAQPSAGPNWGTVLLPRVGTEVAVQFIEGDIDRPVIVGQLYNGQDTPPFAAGHDSGVNHPGAISGWHSHSLGGGAYNQWVLDDSTGQLRTRLLCSYTHAQLGLGHLIQQSPSSAQRGPQRGSGFEALTQGWGVLRAARGVLLSTSARPQAQGSHMDAAEPLGQLRASQALAQRLGQAAQAAGALPLNADAAKPLCESIDPQQNGQLKLGNADGLSASAADGRSPGESACAYSEPHLVLDANTSASLTTPASIMSYSAADALLMAQADTQLSAAHTVSAVSGGTTSLYTHSGGLSAIAANGGTSLRAHTDTLQLWADQTISLTSSNDEIRISAQSKIELTAGQSALTLDGANITFTCPGTFAVHGARHNFLGGESGAVELSTLPDTRLKLYQKQFVARNEVTGQPEPGMGYRIEFGGEVIRGVTDAEGKTVIVRTAQSQEVRLFWEPQTQATEDHFLSTNTPGC